MSPNLNRRLKLSTPYRTRDDAGGYTEAWSVLGELWASVRRSGSGQETDASGITVASIRYEITVRASPLGAPSRPIAGQRLLDGTRLYHILAVTEADAGARYLTCFAQEEEAS